MRKKRRWRENEKEKRGKKNERRQENQDQYRKEFKKKCGFGKRKERTERKHFHSKKVVTVGGQALLGREGGPGHRVTIII